MSFPNMKNGCDFRVLAQVSTPASEHPVTWACLCGVNQDFWEKAMLTCNGLTMSDGQRYRDQEGMRMKAPRLVIVRHLGEKAVALDDYFRQLGWCVKIAEDGANARKLANRAQAVVLPVGGRCESGFLTCAKLVAAQPDVRVVLIGPADEEQERFALFAGAAAYVTDAMPMAEVARLIVGE